MVQINRRTGSSKPRTEWEIPIEPIKFSPRPLKKRIATWDTETDPFLHGRVPAPFTCGFYVPDCDFYIDFWGEDGLCIKLFFAWLAKATGPGGEFEGVEFLILCHNYGNFDAYFCVEQFDAGHTPFIINGRMVRVMAGGHEFRDSYAMMPFALADYQKDTIDYRCMERGFRDVYRDIILSYLKSDCVYLADLVVSWYDLFGDRLTIASAAMPLMRSYQNFETMPDQTDRDLRPYYFGGRTQCFATGVMTGNFYVYDINSSYSRAMRDELHPISATPKYDMKITERTDFAHIRAWSLGALPIRKQDGSLDFPIGTYDFHACGHEIRAGIELGVLRIIKVYHSIYFEQKATFAPFVDDIYGKRLDAAAIGDECRKMHYKYALNSPYGKCAQDPRKYQSWLFDPADIPTPLYCGACHANVTNKVHAPLCSSCADDITSPYGWYLHSSKDGRNIYAAPQRLRASGFFNVALAASITSAARASLLRGLRAATRPLYCDTDSIICEGLEPSPSLTLDPKVLGGWKLEANADTVCIAGKKLYALFKDNNLIKKASKGVRLSGDEIRRVCNGETIEYPNPAPKFSLASDPQFIKRNIRRTM